MSEGTKDKLVFEAMRLFAEKGYSATSIADILKAAGANSGSLYYFFPTKQELLLAVLRAYQAGIGTMLLAPAWEGVSDPIEVTSVRHRREARSRDCPGDPEHRGEHHRERDRPDRDGPFVGLGAHASGPTSSAGRRSSTSTSPGRSR